MELRKFPHFIGGDFNCPLPNEDKKGGQDLSSKKSVITRIKQLMVSFDLVDIWRYLYPRENQFTWSSSDLKVDYWLISRDGLRIVDSSEIEVFPAGARYIKSTASLELRHKDHNNHPYSLHNNTIDFTQQNETIVHILTWYIEHHPCSHTAITYRLHC